MLHYCDEHIDAAKKEEAAKEGEEKDKAAEKKDEDKAPETKDDTFQAFAVLGIALISMGEEIGAEMALRQFNHLVRRFFFFCFNDLC